MSLVLGGLIGGRRLLGSALDERLMLRRRRASRSRGAPCSIGRAYCSANRFGSGNSPGAVNSCDRSSIRLFSIGVPVIASLNGASSRYAAICLSLVVLDVLRLVEISPAHPTVW